MCCPLPYSCSGPLHYSFSGLTWFFPANIFVAFRLVCFWSVYADVTFSLRPAESSYLKGQYCFLLLCRICFQNMSASDNCRFLLNSFVYCLSPHSRMQILWNQNISLSSQPIADACNICTFILVVASMPEYTLNTHAHILIYYLCGETVGSYFRYWGLKWGG